MGESGNQNIGFGRDRFRVDPTADAAPPTRVLEGGSLPGKTTARSKKLLRPR